MTKNKFATALKTASTPSAMSEKATPKAAGAKSRDGTKFIGGHFDPTVSKQLKRISLDEDSTIQDLVAEALDMLFQSRQMPTIAKKPKE